MKDDTLLILAAAGVGGYFLLKGNIAGTIEGVGEGLSTGIQGLGSGIAEVSGDIGQTTGNIADFTNILGEFGLSTATYIDEWGNKLSSELRRETSQLDIVDRASFDKTQDILVDEKSKVDIKDATSQTARNDILEDFKTKTLSDVTTWASAGSSLLAFSPIGSLTNFIKTSTSTLKNIYGSNTNTAGSSSGGTLKVTTAATTTATSGGTSAGNGSNAIRKIAAPPSNALTNAIAATKTSTAPAPTPAKTSTLRSVIKYVFTPYWRR